MAFLYRELVIILGCVLVFAICADNDTTPAPAASTPAATASTSATASTGTMTDLAQFMIKFPFSLLSFCKYGADTIKGIASAIIPPMNG